MTGWQPESPEILSLGYLGYLVLPTQSKHQPPRWLWLSSVQGSPQSIEHMPGWGPGTAALPRLLPGGLESPEIPNSGYHKYLVQLISPDSCKDVGSGHGEWGVPYSLFLIAVFYPIV